jgi:hypothetical protein
MKLPAPMLAERTFRFRQSLYPALAALALSGCVTTMQTPDGSAGITAGAVSYHFGSGGCGDSTNRFQAIIDSDVATGNLNRSVYRRMTADLAPVKAACTAGRNAEAESRLDGVRARYGYH